MSEDVLCLKFKTSGPDAPPRDLQERLAKLVFGRQRGEVSSSDKKGIRTLTFGMCDSLNDGVVKQVLAKVEEQGGREAVASIVWEQTGEESWYAAARGDLVRADTEKALKRTLAERLEPRVALNVFDRFERDDPAAKAVIKLQSASEEAGKSLEEMFSILLERNEDAYARFCAAFAKRCGERKQKSSGIKFVTEWCRFEASHLSGRWFEGPPHIANHVSFVVRAGTDLFVGMDLAPLAAGSGRKALSDFDKFRMDDRLANLLFVLAQLNGVKKGWIRFQFSDEYFAGAWPVPQLDEPCVVDVAYGKPRPEYEW